MKDKQVKAPIGLLIITIFGIFTLISIYSTLNKYINDNGINYSENK